MWQHRPWGSVQSSKKTSFVSWRAPAHTPLGCPGGEGAIYQVGGLLLRTQDVYK